MLPRYSFRVKTARTTPSKRILFACTLIFLGIILAERMRKILSQHLKLVFNDPVFIHHQQNLFLEILNISCLDLPWSPSGQTADLPLTSPQRLFQLFYPELAFLQHLLEHVILFNKTLSNGLSSIFLKRVKKWPLMFFEPPCRSVEGRGGRVLLLSWEKVLVDMGSVSGRRQVVFIFKVG